MNEMIMSLNFSLKLRFLCLRFLYFRLHNKETHLNMTES